MQLLNATGTTLRIRTTAYTVIYMHPVTAVKNVPISHLFTDLQAEHQEETLLETEYGDIRVRPRRAYLTDNHEQLQELLDTLTKDVAVFVDQEAADMLRASTVRIPANVTFYTHHHGPDIRDPQGRMCSKIMPVF
jgi:hypothetical protein